MTDKDGTQMVPMLIRLNARLDASDAARAAMIARLDARLDASDAARAAMIARLDARLDASDAAQAAMIARLDASDAARAAMSARFEATFADYHERLATVEESHPRLASADVDTALWDMTEIYTALRDLVDKRDSWSRTDVGTACYLLFFMVEVAWTLLNHAATDRSPMPFSKQHTTSSSFKIEARKSNSVPYNLPKPIKEPSTMSALARTKLVSYMTQWSPFFCDDNGVKKVVYNSVSYWLMALRTARDIGTHRTLSHIQVPPPDPAGDAPPAASVGPEVAKGGLLIKLPINPAMDFSDYNSHMPFTGGGNGTDPLVHFPATSSRGYCMVPVERMATDMLSVAAAVRGGLEDVVQLCRPCTLP
ncbi:hypothetical protein TSOC_012505 [Tetrabaena socialis]|uniref:Uncharacterized protein n=1 Tax=Tetrabaena socialis TaxID=47790 RepID=A0A2J7ZMU4_9CHLO|nr:hypothetical protein TSOC_012505 [Tetrabaena socialis]|eukprot:PNH01593.1 hypothetical protein TSOC_012505 [Tetrabaena socialis]